ncbi:unnamed protein product [Absidia cylindrospora]
MISAFFIYNQKGEVLISRLYRHDLRRSVADIFRIQVISNTMSNLPLSLLGRPPSFMFDMKTCILLPLQNGMPMLP